jgi:hypothetical protein
MVDDYEDYLVVPFYLDDLHAQEIKEMREIENMLLMMNEDPYDFSDLDTHESEYMTASHEFSRLSDGPDIKGKPMFSDFIDILPTFEEGKGFKRRVGLRTVDDVRTDEDFAEILGINEVKPDVPEVSMGYRLRDGKEIYSMEVDDLIMSWTNWSMFNFLLLCFVLFVFFLMMYVLFVRLLRRLLISVRRGR